MENPSQIIKSPNRHPQMPKYTIRRPQMKMEIRNRILRQISLTALKPIIAHALSFHDDFLCARFLGVKGTLVDAFEEGDGLGDAGLEFGDGGFVVFVVDFGVVEDAAAECFGGVGEGLDLVGETG